MWHALQIQLYEGAGEGVTVSSEDLYDTALAYLAEGYSSRRPQHVRTAHKLLAAVKKQSDAGSSSADAGYTWVHCLIFFNFVDQISAAYCG